MIKKMDVDRSSDSDKSDENSDSNEEQEFENTFTRPAQVSSSFARMRNSEYCVRMQWR